MAQKMLIVRSLPCPITVGCSAYVNLLFLPYLVGLSVVLIVSTRKPVNSGFSGISGEWNISDASVGQNFRKCGIQRKAVVLLQVHDNFLTVYIQTYIYIPVIFIATNNNENWFWTIQFFVTR